MFCLGGFWQGGFCPGVYVRGVFVWGVFVLEPTGLQVRKSVLLALVLLSSKWIKQFI